jgi:uncharacterized protein
MYSEDVELLCCPSCRSDLQLSGDPQTDSDGEILSGSLTCSDCGKMYVIRDAVPRFVEDISYNQTWDYKWVEIDGGRGLNYKVLDETDSAYRTNDGWHRNTHGDCAYAKLKDAVAIDVGCGVGQYSIKMLTDGGAARVVSIDLTRGVDIFRKIILERYPQYRKRLLLVQGDILAMPFRDQQFDYVLSLGVLMHTGKTLAAIRQSARILRYGGEINFWIYAAWSVHDQLREPEGREGLMTYLTFIPFQLYFWKVSVLIKLFRKLPHSVVVKIIRLFSSDPWYRLCKSRYFWWIGALVFWTSRHPDKQYRFVNNYDGSVNAWSEMWSEQEIFSAIRSGELVIKGMSDWRVGIWAVKIRGFYPGVGAPPSDKELWAAAESGAAQS